VIQPNFSEVIAFAFWIDGDTFVYQAVQHTVQAVHLEIDHRFLRWREVVADAGVDEQERRHYENSAFENPVYSVARTRSGERPVLCFQPCSLFQLIATFPS